MDRLNLIASLSSGAKILCDVGCDHAYALEMALTKYDVLRGIASDINEMPLENAKKTLSKANLLDRVDFVLSNGFKNINPGDNKLIPIKTPSSSVIWFDTNGKKYFNDLVVILYVFWRKSLLIGFVHKYPSSCLKKHE